MSNRASVTSLRAHKLARVGPAAQNGDINWSQDDDPLHKILLLGTRCSFAPGQTLFEEGEDLRCFYKIIYGGVRLTRTTSTGKRQIIRFAAGDCFLGLEKGPKHASTAEAICATEVIRCNRSDIQFAGDAYPGLHASLLSIACAELAEMQDHLAMLVGKSARARVAQLLLRVFRPTRVGDGLRIKIPASRLDIADYLGLTVETVCRELGTLKRRAIIGIPNRHEILLRDIQALQAISAGDAD